MSNPLSHDFVPTWVEGLLRTAPVSTPTSLPASLPAWNPSRANDRDANKSPAFQAAHERLEAVALPSRRRVFEALETGRYEAAYQEAQRFDEANPDEWVGNWPGAIESALLAGHYAVAEGLCVKRMRHGSEGDTNLMYLGLSLALASRGRLVPDQAEWVGRRLAQLEDQRGLRQRAVGRLRSPITAKEVATTSAVALGLASMHPHPYLEWALRLDPQCEIAARELIEEYAVRNRRADAARVARSMVQHLPPGPVRDEFARRMAILERPATGESQPNP